ncbi:MAG: hypothetical protein OEO23_11815, partial [Gemmatimonadota bacterium]|nr:hypothetical protein [Gemmatimonadota bacterium]
MRSDSRPGKSRNLDGGEGAPVQWLSPADVRDEAALEPWRRAVGPPLTWSPPVSRGATGGGVGGEAGADRLLVGVWNLRVGGGDLDRFWDRIDSEADGAPVVLLLQEAFSAGDHVPPLATDFAHAGRIADEPSHGPRVDIAAFARRTRLHAFYVPSMRN